MKSINTSSSSSNSNNNNNNPEWRRWSVMKVTFNSVMNYNLQKMLFLIIYFFEHIQK